MQFSMSLIVSGVALTCVVGGASMAQSTPKGGNPEAAKIANQVATTPESIAAGRDVYVRVCAGCHGANGDGRGKAASEYGKKPADLTRAALIYGSTDGEVHDVIKNGVLPDLFMPAWEGQLSETDIWNVVNYLRTLRQK